MKLPAWTYLFVFAAGIGLAFWLMRGCKPSAPDHSSLLVANDSLVKVIADTSKATAKYKDSMNLVVGNLLKEKDSSASIIKEYKIDLHQRGEDIQGLIDELNASESAKDTSRTLTACDSLKNQFASAKGLVGRYIFANDSLQKLNDQIIAAKTEITNRLSQQVTETNQAFFSTQLTLQKIEGDYNKLRTAGNKKFALGPSLGYYVTPKGGGFGIGISLTYTPIRF